MQDIRYCTFRKLYMIRSGSVSMKRTKSSNILSMGCKQLSPYLSGVSQSKLQRLYYICALLLYRCTLSLYRCNYCCTDEHYHCTNVHYRCLDVHDYCTYVYCPCTDLEYLHCTDVHYCCTDVHYHYMDVTIAVQMNNITVHSYTITVQLYTIGRYPDVHCTHYCSYVHCPCIDLEC